MKKGILIISCLIAQLYALAQSVDVRVKLDKEHIQIGDAIQMDLSATYDPQRFVVHFPQVPDTLHGFEIVTREKPDTVFKREINEYHQRFVITHFDSGRWALPAFSFNIESKQGGAPETKHTDTVWVDVGVPIVDTAKPFKPIADVRGAEKPWQDSVLEVAAYVLIGLAVLVFLFFLWKKYKSWRADQAKKPLKPERSPYEQALFELQKIKLEALYEKGEEKLYHTQLTEVLRSYLDKQFGIDSFEKTSAEIMQVVKKHKALSGVRQPLREVLETADMVKFAKSIPTKEEHERSLNLTEEIIRDSFKKFQNQQVTPA